MGKGALIKGNQPLVAGTIIEQHIEHDEDRNLIVSTNLNAGPAGTTGADGATGPVAPNQLTDQQLLDALDLIALLSQITNSNTSGSDIVPTGLAVSSTGISIGIGGAQTAYVILTWTAIASDTFDHYQIRYKKGIYTYYTYIDSKTNTITIDGLVPNTSYNFGIASVNKYGTSSAFSADITQVTASDSTAPATVTIDSATAGIQYIIVEWTSSTDLDLDSYNIYRNTVNDSGTSVLIGNTKTNYFIDGNRVGGTEYFYWIKAKDTSGNLSASYSTMVSATPRNVTSADIVTLAASKVLIDGVVYLSNWRHASDLTKIDGGDIYANSVTLTQLNFVPVQGTDVIAKINASTEGITIDADNITISGSTTFASGYNPTGRVLAVGGSYDSAASGARVRIFPDANTGIQVIDDAAADVFKVEVGGTNVGDVTIGDWSGGQGIKYDKSAGTTSFAGILNASAGIIGGFTIGTTELEAGSGVTKIKLQVGQGLWMGADSAANAPFYLTISGAIGGVLKATIIDEIGTYIIDTESRVAIEQHNIWDNSYDSDSGILNINVLGYNKGYTRKRSTRIGDGQGNSVLNISSVGATIQQGGLKISPTITPTISSIFTIDSTTKGILLPRMTETERDAIVTPAEGLLIYNLSTHVYNFHNGTAWGAI